MRLLSWITLANVLVSSGFSVTGLISPLSILPPDTILTEASSIFGMYAAVRTLSLAVMAVIVVYRQLPSALVVIGILAGVDQFMDGFIGIYQHDVGKAVGPFLIAAIQFYAVFAFRRTGVQTRTIPPTTSPQIS
jgi:hypothetical protein